MKDILGNELNVGDKVAYTVSFYHHLVVGEVIAILPKTVRCVSKEVLGRGEVLNSGNTIARDSIQVVKIS